MKNELAFFSKEDALKVAELLLQNDYCVLLSKEDDLTVLNYEYSQYSDRNDVVFMSAEEFDSKYCEMESEENENA